MSSSLPYDRSGFIPKRVSFRNSASGRFVPKRATVFQPDDPIKKSLAVVCPEEEDESAELSEPIITAGLNLFPSANDLPVVQIVSDETPIAQQAIGLAAQTPLRKVDHYPETSLLAPFVQEPEFAENLASDTPGAEDAYLAKLLGRQLTRWDREEYYWEELTPEGSSSDSTLKYSLTQGVANAASKPIEWIGRATLSLFKPVTKAIRDDGDESFVADEEMNKPHRVKKGRGGGLSDFMISVVAGVLIATVIVFPVLRFVGREVIVTIAKSAVRKIGQKVSIQHGQDSSILLPFLSEQMLHPKHTVLNPDSQPSDAPSNPTSSADP